MYERKEVQVIKSRLEEPRRFIQVVMGPRQTGKTTAVRQALARLGLPHLFFSADDVAGSGRAWIADCWEAARC